MAVKEDAPLGKTEKVKNGQKKAAKPVEDKRLKIRLVRSLIGRPRKQHEVVKGLGLRRINSEVIRKDCPEIWGMIRKVPHLVIVEELDTK